jgi:pimeloyl-ACP methyl ester carboxylesterase
MDHLEVDGALLAYRVQGDGPPVLFIHGSGTYSDQFESMLTELVGDFRAIVYDRRGFAASADQRAGSLTDHVSDAIALIGAVAGGPVTLVGSSAGGVLALRIAVERPDLVNALVLIEPAFQMAMTPSLSANAALARIYARWLLRRDPEGAALSFFRWATRYKDGKNQFDTYPDAWRAQALKHGSNALRELGHLVRPLPSQRSLRSIKVPCTVVIGDAGLSVFHRTSRRVLRTIPGAIEVPAAGAAHLVYTDQPAMCARAVAETVGRVGRS